MTKTFYVLSHQFHSLPFLSLLPSTLTPLCTLRPYCFPFPLSFITPPLSIPSSLSPPLFFFSFSSSTSPSSSSFSYSLLRLPLRHPMERNFIALAMTKLLCKMGCDDCPPICPSTDSFVHPSVILFVHPSTHLPFRSSSCFSIH